MDRQTLVFLALLTAVALLVFDRSASLLVEAGRDFRAARTVCAAPLRVETARLTGATLAFAAAASKRCGCVYRRMHAVLGARRLPVIFEHPVGDRFCARSEATRESVFVRGRVEGVPRDADVLTIVTLHSFLGRERPSTLWRFDLAKLREAVE